MRSFNADLFLANPLEPVGSQQCLPEFRNANAFISDGVSGTIRDPCTWTMSRAGLHDDVPDRPSAKVASVGCQLATMALQIKTVTIPFGMQWWVAGQKWSPSLGRQCIWAELHETEGLSATLALNRLGRCRATRSRSPRFGGLRAHPSYGGSQRIAIRTSITYKTDLNPSL